MSRSNYRAGIIGLGFVGGADQVSGDVLGQQVRGLDGTHLHALAGNARVELVAGSSRDAGRRERFEQRSGAKTYTNWREMIEREKLDIVSVATYTPSHAEITMACAERSIPVIYCEKPIASRLVDAERMVSACEDAGSLLVVNHNRRFNPRYRRLRDLIKGGGLGDLTSVSQQWPAGRLGNVGTHMIDAARMLTGRSIQSVCAVLDLAGKPDCRGEQFSDPGGWVMMRLEHDLMMMIDAADYAQVPARLRINGTKGRALTGRQEVRVEYWDGTVEGYAAPKDGASSMDVAVAKMVDYLDNKIEFIYTGRESLQTFESIVACHASYARNATWVNLPLTGADRDHEVLSG